MIEAARLGAMRAMLASSRSAWRSPALKSARSKVLVLGFGSVASLLGATVIIGYGGAGAYAAVALVGSLIALVPFADFGTGAAITNSLASAPDSEGYIERVSGTMLSSFRVLLLAAMTVIGMATVAAISGAFEILLGFSSNGRDNTMTAALVVTFVCFGIALPFGIGQRVLLGVKLNHLAVRCQLAAPATVIVTIVFVTVADLDAWWFAVSPGISVLVVNVVTWSVATKHAPVRMGTVATRAVRVRAFRGARIIGTAGPMILVSVGLPLALQSDRLILAQTAGQDALASYSLAAQLYSPFWAVVSTAGLTLWPTFAAMRGTDRSALPTLYKAVAGLFVAALSGAFVLMTLGGTAADLISNGAIVVGLELLALFSLLLVVQAIQLPAGMALTDRGGLWFQAACVVAMVPVNIALSVSLASSHGAVGPVAGSVIAIGVCQLIPCFFFARYQLSRKQARGY